ncbi:MAG TPA: DUF2254 domain-containing protein [Chloroflexia bacterium]|jgi:uncharacterized membrane protein
MLIANRIRRVWNDIQGSLWFVPSVLVLLAAALAFFMAWLDKVAGKDVATALPFLAEVGSEGTRDILSTIAGSMLTVAGIAFSFTIVVFSFASSQYSSRTLHNFMDDNLEQTVLGVLLGSFVYCLLILRTVRIETGAPVPVLSVSIALILALIDLGLFILFIHHIAESIQAYHIINRIGHATAKSINEIFPRDITIASEHIDEARRMVLSGPTREVLAHSTGYIQFVEEARVMQLTYRYDVVVALEKRVGNFVIKGEIVATVGPAPKANDTLCQEIRDCFIVGKHRTIFQDPQYGILQLSDIAIKALSPAINDPNTAIMSLNELGSVLRQLAGRELPDPVRCDSKGKVRVIVKAPTFDSMVAQAFDQIRRYGMSDAAIPLKMLDVIGEIADETDLEFQLKVLREHAQAIMEDAERSVAPQRDREMIQAKMRSLEETFERKESVLTPTA